MSDYRQIFGREAEPWREPLGALRITLWGEDFPQWIRDGAPFDSEKWGQYQDQLDSVADNIERARSEVEWLTRVLNGEEG